jgi:hypothetical protein
VKRNSKRHRGSAQKSDNRSSRNNQKEEKYKEQNNQISFSLNSQN